MTYAQFITLLRSECRDYAKPMHNDMTGDGTTSLFQVTDFPVLEGSYIVQVAGSQKTEGTDYTFDKESGVITFASAPAAAAAVDVDFKFVNVSDTSWIAIINRVIMDLQGSFFREVVDDDFEDTVNGEMEKDAPENCLDVIQWWYKTSDDTSTRWTLVGDTLNWRYSKESNKIHLGVAFNSEYRTKLHYLQGYTLGDATTDTVDFQTEYMGVLQLGCMWKFYDYRLADRVNTETKVTQERTLTPLENLRNLSAHYYNLYSKEKGRKKPTKPGRLITNRLATGGIA